MKKDLNLSIPKSYSESTVTAKNLNKLSFGKQKIIISNEELEKLEKIYHKYVDVFGVDIGFINYLLRLV